MQGVTNHHLPEESPLLTDSKEDTAISDVLDDPIVGGAREEGEEKSATATTALAAKAEGWGATAGWRKPRRGGVCSLWKGRWKEPPVTLL